MFAEVIVVVNKTSLPDIKKTLKECLQVDILCFRLDITFII